MSDSVSTPRRFGKTISVCTKVQSCEEEQLQISLIAPENIAAALGL